MLNLPDIKRWLSSHAPQPAPDDSLEVFGSEHTAPPRFARPDARRALAAVALFTIVPALVVGGYALQKARPFQVEASSTALTIQSSPPGAEVHLAGTPKGTTPLTLSVAPGTHTFEIIHGERRKSLTAMADAGAAVVHHVELPEPAPPPVEASAPDPAPAKARTAAAPAGPVGGWLTVDSPVPLQVMEGNDVIGSSTASRIMLRAGRHELRLYNASLGFSERRVVHVTAGRNESVRVRVPTAPVNINAVPWAEAWIDGKRVGETPIGNHLVPIGAHEIVFRHPEFGERRQTVVVSLHAPARVSVDMRRR